jgi:hypothetical protein
MRPAGRKKRGVVALGPTSQPQILESPMCKCYI